MAEYATILTNLKTTCLYLIMPAYRKYLTILCAYLVLEEVGSTDGSLFLGTNTFLFESFAVVP